ncbi:MAG: hypothetical protein R2911_21410 [Caldilineaceae bacterium]
MRQNESHAESPFIEEAIPFGRAVAAFLQSAPEAKAEYALYC